MTILVTGASGGLGKAILPLLRQKYNQTVVATGRNKSEFESYVYCDLTVASSVSKLIKKTRPSIIYHLAGSFTGQFEIDFSINIHSAKYIFESILTEGLDARVIIIGSAAEYGAVLTNDNPISETFPCRPISMYGLTKMYQTDLARFYARTTKLDIVIARIFNLAIPGLSQRLFYGRAEELIKFYKQGKVSHLEFGNLDSERDYIELESAFEQLMAIADRGISGEIYNVGSGVPKSMRNILIEMLEKEGIKHEGIIKSRSNAVGRLGFDVAKIYADVTKTSKLLAESF